MQYRVEKLEIVSTCLVVLCHSLLRKLFFMNLQVRHQTYHFYARF